MKGNRKRSRITKQIRKNRINKREAETVTIGRAGQKKRDGTGEYIKKEREYKRKDNK